LETQYRKVRLLAISPLTSNTVTTSVCTGVFGNRTPGKLARPCGIYISTRPSSWAGVSRQFYGRYILIRLPRRSDGYDVDECLQLSPQALWRSHPNERSGPAVQHR